MWLAAIVYLTPLPATAGYCSTGLLHTSQVKMHRLCGEGRPFGQQNLLRALFMRVPRSGQHIKAAAVFKRPRDGPC